MKLFLLSSILFAVARVASLEARVEAERPGRNTQHQTLSKRREWRTLDRSEKKAFIDAVKCLGGLPHDTNLAPTGVTPDIPAMNTSSSYYDDFVYVHIDSNIKDHFTAHVKNITNAPVFDADPESGLGTFGTSADDQWAVKDGAFATTVRAYPTPHTVGRNFNPRPFREQVFPFAFEVPELDATQPLSPESMRKIVGGSAGNYTDFAYKLDGVAAQGPHNAAHLMMGGDMRNLLWSPNDPLFYLHHAHLDCVWEKWQNRRPENAMAYGGGLTQDVDNYDLYPVGAPPAANFSSILPTEGLTPSFRVGDMMSTKKLGYTCIW
ncbi:tyrosinase [Rhizoctonia solani]|uniref:Tyrosinase n=1 Tax=Rhizoctonia solani TaxID=456999 RepID=A0A0K6GJ49_9AGAM|nr:tyrosinase [Rhizoctonia solani]